MSALDYASFVVCKKVSHQSIKARVPRHLKAPAIPVATRVSRAVHFQMIQASRQSHQWQQCRLQCCALTPHVSLSLRVNVNAVTVTVTVTVHVTESLTTETVTVVTAAIVVISPFGRGLRIKT